MPTPRPISRRSLLGAAAGASALSAGGLGGLGLATAAPAEAAGHAPRTTRYFSGMFREVDDHATLPAAVRHDYDFTPASVMWFDNWGSGLSFPVAEARSLWRQGVMPHFTWEPWDAGLALDDPDQLTLETILSGRWDAYITARAKEFAAVRAPMIVRFAHEFNGNWYPWAVATNGQDPDRYVRAFRYVHRLVSRSGARNVQWCWAYNNGPSPVADWNRAALAYPGADYVDWIGIDAYNWGFGPSWDPGVDHWQSFEQMIGDAYDQARAIDPGKPVMLGEFASSDDGGDKTRWLRQLAEVLATDRFAALRLLTYFDIDKEEHWSLADQAASIRSFVRGHRAAFAGTGRQLAAVARDCRHY